MAPKSSSEDDTTLVRTPRTPLGDITINNQLATQKPQARKKTKPATHWQAVFTAPCLEAIARATVNHDPFSAKHGQKMKAWQEVLCEVQGLGFCAKSSWESVKNKVMDLISWHNVSTQ
jgi:hypothetical protein